MMQVAVWDTYVDRPDGRLMHFDVLVPVELEHSERVIEFVKLYLEEKTIDSQAIALKKCAFCHIESATVETVQAIESKGFDIIEFENCV